MKLPSFSVTTMLGIAFGAMMVTAVLAAAVTYWRSSEASEATRAAGTLQDGLSRLENYKQSIDQATGAVRGFMLTGDRAQLKIYESAVANRTQRLKALKDSGAVDASSVDALESAYAAWQAKFAERQIKLMRDPLTVDLARAIEATGEPRKTLISVDDQMKSVREKLLERIAGAEKLQTASMTTLEMVAIASGAISLVMTLIFAFLSYRLISRPISELADTTMSLAEGKLETEIGHTGRSDEIGAVSKALVVFRDHLARSRELEEDAKKSDEQRRTERRRELNELADEFENSVRGVVELVGSAARELSSSAQALSTIAEKTSAQAVAVSEASTEAAGNVDNVAVAADQLSSAINEIGGQITTNSNLVNHAADDATSTSTSVNELGDVVQKVGEVTDLIRDIAEQTNLLALNATIEAARAGEAGKGFAVVAGEVKDLASQTGKATEQIDGQIAEMQTRSKSATGAVETIGERLQEMRETAASIAAAVEQQNQATMEIARSVQQAASGTKAVTENIESVRTAATETGQMSSDVQNSANELEKQANTLSEQVDAFVAKVRAA
ncbi:MAG: methyl-accepting chemotaxis protein [Hyphomicrobiaceae bacterium]|nr:methyl-accepting chemotaxis protein [Hyphomicrobiaceae bacterium]